MLAATLKRVDITALPVGQVAEYRIGCWNQNIAFLP